MKYKYMNFTNTLYELINHYLNPKSAVNKH